MIKSMTGFGRHETVTEDYKLTVEIKAVNHKYCDINIKLPKKFNQFETWIRGLMKEYATRGKIDMYISYEDYSGKHARIHYHEHVAGEYMDAIRKASEAFHIDPGITAASLVRFPEVIELEDEDEDDTQWKPVLEETIRGAAIAFCQAREEEGDRLYQDVMGKLDHVAGLVEAVEKRSPQIVQEYRRKLMAKVEEMLGDTQIDDSVLATELTVFADKICVDEETVRLRSHITNMQDTLQKEESIGRKLDFIAQEMNREANTTLSKANDMELSNIAIELKTEIEKIREQIQNIE